MVGEEEEHKYSYRRKGGVKDGWREGGDERWREDFFFHRISKK